MVEPTTPRDEIALLDIIREAAGGWLVDDATHVDERGHVIVRLEVDALDLTRLMERLVDEIR